MIAYSHAQALKATPLTERPARFRDLGGRIQGPEDDGALCYYDEMLWQIELGGTQAEALTLTGAIARWIRLVIDRTPMRAPDGLPDCPYCDQRTIAPSA